MTPRRGRKGGRRDRQRGGSPRLWLYLGKDFAGGGEPPAADLDTLGGVVLTDGVYVG